ncbi:hypothetical protein UFOVP474_24 [uncultured Caudovirales phage]|uniref:Uncharacterized protein n=1 Tax=uncultured Caudovirales phage TaxID=2100421 RepID=A0A6J5MQA0_9CAUD|nr:hypothetical protein UFOVP474_24 [uncultured Caudovirales phage]CAB4189641.1 hypothetical protein UFOVP1207_20 [uncultured Caudovirales phage]
MNLLQLVNQARVECGVSGPALTTAVGQTGESGRMVAWVVQAWTDIQTSKEDWLFMRESFDFNTTANVWEYSPTDAGLTDFGNWKRDSFRCASDLTLFRDEQLLNYMEWTTFRNLYRYANMRNTTARPVVVSIMPNKDLAFGSTPDGVYVIDGEYYTQPVTLAADADTPLLPTRFHMAIVYRSMMYYAGYEAAPEVMARGDFEYRRLYSRMEIDQLPTLISGPPLA